MVIGISVEDWAVLSCLDGGSIGSLRHHLLSDSAAMALSATSIGALSVFIKGGTFFILGSLGVQDGRNMLLLSAFGYFDVTGITFALLRRFHELVWIGLGLFCLTLVGGRSVVIQAGRMPDSGNGSWLPTGCSFTFTVLSKSKSRKSRAPVESSGSVGPSRPIRNREDGDLRYVPLG